jgi:hypothetical protein
MEYTTHFGLHSQTTRLFESVSNVTKAWIIYGILTLYDAPFQETYTQPSQRKHLYKLQFSCEILNLSSSRFIRHY